MTDVAYSANRVLFSDTSGVASVFESTRPALRRVWPAEKARMQLEIKDLDPNESSIAISEIKNVSPSRASNVECQSCSST